MDLWRESRKQNAECAAAIKDAMDKADAAGEQIMGGLNGMPAGLF